MQVTTFSSKGLLIDSVAQFESESPITCLAVLPSSALRRDERYSVVGREDGAVEVRANNADFSHNQVWTLRDHSAKVTAVALLERMQLLATASLDRSLAIYRCSRVAAGKSKPLTLLVTPHRGAVTAVAWDRGTIPIGSDAVTLATGGDDGEVKLWKLSDVLGGKGSLEAVRTLEGHLGPVVSLDCRVSAAI